ncbi:hypothetical protein [Pseudomonas phage COT4]|uniref:dATP/dGTP diphosphohydrolase N-terminal domain-containing protein n=1 Tax=Pseudomonas phage M5.1 TaxID=2873460 RepID=A0AAE8XFR4_9CAUD|nr:hypothetical protein QGX13_gp100 [Pseudomonas phage M5.1]UAV89723.1 hypothetical protein M51_142 [Pseudomonas phage M5.1]UGL61323.1 hypothetical protein [Pseudomonas phage COT4]
MSIRVLTIDEMLAQQAGDQAILIKRWRDLPVGTPLVRRESYRDDHASVAYFFRDDKFEFFEEGEVGVQEVTKHPLIVKPSKEQIERPAEELGVYRPELETRKIGKIRVELVDEGFPLALREVAHVMTWAQTAKGYKDHDWQNLPNAEVALAAAASRHRTDHIKQRVVDDLPIDQCVDGESGLLHKAHEAFGVLAQLELMLRGKFVDSRPQIGV